jgi:hypothetical protein
VIGGIVILILTILGTVAAAAIAHFHREAAWRSWLITALFIGQFGGLAAGLASIFDSTAEGIWSALMALPLGAAGMWVLVKDD